MSVRPFHSIDVLSYLQKTIWQKHSGGIMDKVVKVWWSQVKGQDPFNLKLVALL